ncbi:MAG: RNA 3'-terminal phosphate cyclase (ATP) [Flavobacteriales bacterium]|jgi:RNA 3'-terminal phosphate cyclase (ATP)
MKIIDGSAGEGGGQIFRTSLTLAMCLGELVQINNIRAGRKRPGLLRQHLACLKAASEICGAQVTGDVLGSQAVTFKPAKIKSGNYQFSIATAGSTTLIFQTVVLPLFRASGVSTLSLSGGTHNGMAPSFEFISKSFLPLMERIGFYVDVELHSYGFYPAGGGQWRATVSPVGHVKALELLEPQEVVSKKAIAIASKVPFHVCERELQQVENRCNWGRNSLENREVNSVGPGNMLSLQVATNACVNVFDVFGEKRVSAERVANKAIDMLRCFEAAKVAVNEHLADQLLLPLVLGGGGRFTTSRPLKHLLSNIDVIEQFLPGHVNLSQVSDSVWMVEVRGQISTVVNYSEVPD